MTTSAPVAVSLGEPVEIRTAVARIHQLADRLCLSAGETGALSAVVLVLAGLARDGGTLHAELATGDEVVLRATVPSLGEAERETLQRLSCVADLRASEPWEVTVAVPVRTSLAKAARHLGDPGAPADPDTLLERQNRALLDAFERLRAGDRALAQALASAASARADARRAREELARVVALASHDLKQPLQAVDLQVQVLGRLFEGDARAARMVANVRAASGRMRQMIVGLVEYLRVADDEDFFEAATPAGDALQRAVASLAPRAEGLQIEAGELPDLAVRPAVLSAIFEHLLEGALSRDADHPARFTVFATRDGPRWRVALRDEGSPVPAGLVPRAFDLFGGLSSDRPAGPSLAIAWKLVERSGGEVGLSSDDVGTTFWFTVPGPR